MNRQYRLKGGEEWRDGVLYGWTGRLCAGCNGTGESNYSRLACNQCGGTGEEWGKMPVQPGGNDSLATEGRK